MFLSYLSRREFLEGSSAAVALGCARAGFAQELRASEPVAAQAAIACLRREASEAARDVLQQGGNAIDAAVAALLVQFVIEPSNVGFGGYGGSLAY
jgi:gamma-glutamyltranspeptidase / glutathione hydrolase